MISQELEFPPKYRESSLQKMSEFNDEQFISMDSAIESFLLLFFFFFFVSLILLLRFYYYYYFRDTNYCELNVKIE